MSDSGEMEYRAFKMIIDSSKEELGIHDCRKWGGFIYLPKKVNNVSAHLPVGWLLLGVMAKFF
jgi:hypothetical protein